MILVRDGTIHLIDLAGLLSGSRPVPNPALRPGDGAGHVPDQSGDQVFVLGAVSRPSPVTLSQDSKSIIQVLTETGGIDSTRGKDSGISLIFRPHVTEESKGWRGENFSPLIYPSSEGVLLAESIPA